MSTLKMVCAAWGDWDPPQVPKCVRKCFIILERGPDFFVWGGGVTIKSFLVLGGSLCRLNKMAFDSYRGQ